MLGKLRCTAAMVLFASLLLQGCATGGGFTVYGNEGGSEPNNEKEAVEYQKVVNRCHRTGGSRVVKIQGELRCF